MISPIYAYFWEDGNCLDAGGLEGGIGISTADVKKIVSVKIQDEARSFRLGLRYLFLVILY